MFLSRVGVCMCMECGLVSRGGMQDARLKRQCLGFEDVIVMGSELRWS